MSNYNLSYLRRAKADSINDIYNEGIPREENICVERYEQATVLPCTLTENGDMWRECVAGVIDKNGAIVPISCTWQFTKMNHVVSIEEYSEQNVLYIGSFRSHWGHFLIDLVPRLWYVLENEKDKIDAYVISGEFNGEEEIQLANIKEFLELLGILDKTTVVNVPTMYKSVVVPEKAYYYGKAINDSREKHKFSSRYLNIFNYIVDKVLKKYEKENRKKAIPKKIFMTRRSNLECGIELIDSFFENNGYMIFDPAEATLTELIILLNKCERIAYVSGTLQHNMLFAPNGIKTVAIESRTYVSPVQIDIDMMKDINVTYIDANYSIVKDFWHYYRLYGYTRHFKQYVKDKKKLKPDVSFLKREYLQENIRKYLCSYRLPNRLTFKHFESDYSGYEITVYQESVLEINNELNINIEIKSNGNYDRESIIAETSIILKELKVPYWKWKENTYSNKYQTFCGLIKLALDQRDVKKFMIYPYGENGMLCKLILKEVFGIEPIIFDNKVCQYNTLVYPVKDIEQMQNNTNILILTSSKEECIKEIENYYDFKTVFGPYTVY